MLKFKTAAGEILEFEDAPLGQGGEGAVYKQYDKLGYGDVGNLAKIFNDAKRQGKEEKLKAMMRVKNPQPSYRYVWPRELLYDCETGAFCGYTMYLKSNKVELADIYGYNSPYRLRKEWRFFVAIAKNLALAVQGVHDVGQVIGDLNDKNILVDVDNCEVTIIDNDSFHIITDDDNPMTYRCAVGRSEYIPPEIQNVNLETVERNTFTVHTDNFSLAVLLYKLLMNGVHPFNSVGIDENSIEDNIRHGMSPYFSNDKDALNTAFYAPSIDILPPKLRSLFKLGLVDGAVSAQKRPPAIAYHDELKGFLSDANNLYKCPNVPHHIFPNVVMNCPWCEIDARLNERLNMIMAVSDTPIDDVFDYSVGTEESKIEAAADPNAAPPVIMAGAGTVVVAKPGTGGGSPQGAVPAGTPPANTPALANTPIPASAGGAAQGGESGNKKKIAAGGIAIGALLALIIAGIIVVGNMGEDPVVTQPTTASTAAPTAEVTEPPTTEPEVIVGDIDGDGMVTMTDALELLMYTIGSGGNVTALEDPIAVCDVDGDGMITMNDALEVLKYAIGADGVLSQRYVE